MTSLKYILDFAKQKFAVIGLGDTGLSIINYLKYKNANISKIFDTRSNPPQVNKVKELLVRDSNLQENKNITFHFGTLDYANLTDIDVIIISPGVSIYDEALQLAIRNNKIVIGDIELFAQAISNWSSKIIGITGSNGKTTVTTLTGYLLENLGYKTLVAGNIGTPVLTSYLDIIETNQIPEYIVLELSSFQLETLYSMQFTAATVLNISEDHLDRYRDLLEYAYAKGNIFNNCLIQVLNADDKLVMAMLRPHLKNKFFGFNSLFKIVYTKNNAYLNIHNKEFMPCRELGLIGIHNYFNILSTLALIEAAGIDISQDKIKNLLREFKGLEHRMQKVLEHDGVIYIEDSKGTNVGAVVAGVSGLDMPVNLILGGDGKGQDFSPLRDLVISKCKSVAIIGQDKDKIAAVLNGINVSIKIFDTLEEATDFCHENASANEYVVLSPACASWDMFDNYKHRAEVFVKKVNEYKN